MDKSTNLKADSKTFKPKFQELFSFFKLSKKKREMEQEPKNLITWIKHGLSEFFGTIFLSLTLAGLSTYFGGQQFEHKFLVHPVLIGFYAGFIAVGLCLIIFLRWSCDLNPAVTLTRYLNGTNTGRYALMKFANQMLGCVIAALIIYGSGRLFNPEGLANQPIDAYNSATKSFENFHDSSNAIALGGTWIFFIEIVMTSILLFPIFSPNIKDKYRDMLICFVIALSVWMGLLSGTAALNPARGLAQQLPTLMFTGQFESLVGTTTGATGNLGVNLQSVQVATASMFFGCLLSPIFYLFAQGFAKTIFNPMLVGLIHYKNYKSINMHYTNKK